MRVEDIGHKIVNLALINSKHETKCIKMTDENESTIKNGINGASGSVSAALTTTIQVSRGNPILPNSIHRGQQNRNKCGEALRSAIPVESGLSGNQVNICDFGRIPISANNYVKDSRSSSNPGVGGRLQFFKDGKFILELATSKEGEKFGWISVPRKAFRSPSTSSSVLMPSYPKNESSTSLSFSDDNSSIQSSPWQRDHSWKQSTPQKGLSKECCLYYQRSKEFRFTSDGLKASKLKKRRPYDKSVCKSSFAPKDAENNPNSSSKVTPECITDDKLDATIEIDKSNNEGEHTEVNGEKRLDRGAKLDKIIKKLNTSLQAKLFSLSTKPPINGGLINSISATTSSRLADSHYHQPHVSPRKRILREFEKVTLEDNKRSRAKGNSPLLKSTLSPSSKANTSSVNSISHYQNNGPNGNRTESNNHTNNIHTTIPSTTKSYSSYSINSLLGNSNGSSHKEKVQTGNNNDQTYLRTMLTSPKSPESSNHSYGKVSPYSVGSSSRKRSPPYSPLHDIHHSRIRSPTIEGIYGNMRSPEGNHNRSLHSARSTPPQVHPYLASPKYYNSSLSDNHKLKGDHHYHHTQNPANSPNNYFLSGYLSSPKYPPTLSPNHPGSPNNNLRIPTDNRSPGSSQIPHKVRGRETSPANVRDSQSSPGISEQNVPRTVPKKTVSIRQQFASSLTPSPNQVENLHSKPADLKQHAKYDESTNHSPEKSKPSYMSDNKHNVVRSSPVSSMALPSSPMYYLYPPNNVSPSSHTSSSSYIPPAPYYHQYAAAVAALRNPVWMHYPPGVIPSHATSSSRLLPSPFFPYNGVGATGLAASHLQPPLNAMHLSAGHLDHRPPLDHQSPSTEEQVTLISIKDEPSSDVPLNLSKH